MSHCKNLYYLSSIVCMLTECMTEAELEILSSDLLTLGEMIESVMVRQAHCRQVLSSRQPQERSATCTADPLSVSHYPAD